MSTSIGKEFMGKTQFAYLHGSGQSQGVPQPPLETPVARDTAIIKLPEPDLLPEKTVNFLELIEIRTSRRQYGQDHLSLQDLSYLLWCTQGVKMVMPGNATFRTVPSAGARHAFDTYILVNRVEGLEPGIYRFMAIDHVLAEVQIDSGLCEELTEACLNQQIVKTSAVTFFWVAATERMTWRYGERGYRYLFLDAGHICQNLYLAGQTIHCGTCAIGAFDDGKVNEILGVDGETQYTVYAASVGK